MKKSYEQLREEAAARVERTLRPEERVKYEGSEAINPAPSSKDVYADIPQTHIRGKYLGNTFSPMMLGKGVKAEVVEVGLSEFPTYFSPSQSVISHEVTAAVISVILGQPVPFNRVNLTLEAGDRLYCIVPNFRATEAREFSREEVESAGYRAFLVKCY